MKFPKDSLCARRLATERGSNCLTGVRVNMIEMRKELILDRCFLRKKNFDK